MAECIYVTVFQFRVWPSKNISHEDFMEDSSPEISIDGQWAGLVVVILPFLRNHKQAPKLKGGVGGLP